MARINKTIDPGFIEAKINLITLDKPPFKNVAENEVYLVLHLETTKPEEGFIGFDRVYGKPELGKAEGQVGKVKSNRYSYRDGELDGGRKLNRDQDITNFMEYLCTELGIIGWLKEAKEKCAVADELVDLFNEERPFEGRYLHWNIGSRVYKNKAGYDAHDLYLNYGDKGYKQLSMKEWEVNPSVKEGATKKESKPSPEPKKDTPKQTVAPKPDVKKQAMSPNEDFLKKKEEDSDELPFALSGQQKPVANVPVSKIQTVSPDILSSDDEEAPF